MMNEETKKSCTSFVDCLCDIFLQLKIFKRDDIEALKKDFYDGSIAGFEYFLMEQGLTDKEDLLRALGVFYQTQAIDVVGYFFDNHLITMFPKDEMLRNMFIPYQRDGSILFVIAANPRNPDLPAIIGKYVSYDVTFFVGLAYDIDNAVKEFFDKPLYEVEPDIIDAEDARREEHPVETMIDELQADEDREGN